MQIHARIILGKGDKHLLHENLSPSHSDPTYTSSMAEASSTSHHQHLHQPGGERGCLREGSRCLHCPSSDGALEGLSSPTTSPALGNCSSSTETPVSSGVLLQKSCQIWRENKSLHHHSELSWGGGLRVAGEVTTHQAAPHPFPCLSPAGTNLLLPMR